MHPWVYILPKSDNGRVKSFRKELWFEVPGRRAFLNITPEVQTCLRESGVTEGLVLINAMHITLPCSSTTMNRASTPITEMARKARPPRADLAVPA
jgi:thiamine phosphate synthase YjbQ (UPF0047 family)